MKSIQTKILVVVISGLLIMTAVITAIGVTMTHEVIHQDADRILKNACEREAAKLNDMFNDITAVTSVTKHYAAAELGDVTALKDATYKAEYVKTVETMFSEVVLNAKGVKGYYFRTNPEFSDSKSGFYKVKGADDEFVTQEVTDLSKYTEQEIQYVGWYYSAKNAKENEGVWLSPYKFANETGHTISYVMPIYKDGVFAAMVGVDLDFDYMLAYIDKVAVYEEGYAVLVSEDGATTYKHGGSAAHIDTSDHLHAAVAAELENGMKIELRAEYKDIQEKVRPILSKIVIAFIGVLAVFVIYAVVVTHRIVAPLKRLTHSAERVAEGEMDVEFDINSKDEIGRLSDVFSGAYTKLREYTNYINTLAHRDSLTGLQNRTAYDEAVDEIDKEINHGKPEFAVLVCDLNNLKQTNDKYGHDVGNELLIHTAKILNEAFKHSPIFRIGGDEFVIILRGKDFDNYHKRIKKLDELSAQNYVSVNEDKIVVSIARGIAVYNPEVDKVFKDVFENADQVMYLHKQDMKTVKS